MKPLAIYHADCIDGFAAAFAAWLKLGDEAEYVPMHYGDNKLNHPFDLREMVLDRDVYILDFSFIRPVMDQIFSDATRVVWLDHHKSAFEMWCGHYTKDMFWSEESVDNTRHIILDDTKSGALLAWEYFHPGTEVPMLIKHIDDRDRWQFKLKGSKALHAALASYKPWSFALWHYRFTAGGEKFLVDEEVYALIDEGAAILRAQDQHVQSMCKQARKCTIRTTDKLGSVLSEPFPVFFGLAVNATLHISEVGHELANSSGSYGLVWYVGADRRVKCSLRSNGDYDVSAIARAFGGGGHRNAAGFETDVDTLMGWLA